MDVGSKDEAEYDVALLRGSNTEGMTGEERKSRFTWCIRLQGQVTQNLSSVNLPSREKSCLPGR